MQRYNQKWRFVPLFHKFSTIFHGIAATHYGTARYRQRKEMEHRGDGFGTDYTDYTDFSLKPSLRRLWGLIFLRHEANIFSTPRRLFYRARGRAFIGQETGYFIGARKQDEKPQVVIWSLVIKVINDWRDTRSLRGVKSASI